MSGGRSGWSSANTIELLYRGNGLGLASWILGRSDGTLAFEATEPRGTVVALAVREAGAVDGN